MQFSRTLRGSILVASSFVLVGTSYAYASTSGGMRAEAGGSGASASGEMTANSPLDTLGGTVSQIRDQLPSQLLGVQVPNIPTLPGVVDTRAIEGLVPADPMSLLSGLPVPTDALPTPESLLGRLPVSSLPTDKLPLDKLPAQAQIPGLDVANIPLQETVNRAIENPTSLLPSTNALPSTPLDGVVQQLPVNPTAVLSNPTALLNDPTAAASMVTGLLGAGSVVPQ